VDPRIIVALDTDRSEDALALVHALKPAIKTFKIGLQLFTAHGPEIVRQVAATGADIFLDLKFHDIPNTVAGAVYSTGNLPGVRLLTLHAGGGRRMLEAAVEARQKLLDEAPEPAMAPRLLGVTVLTSMDSDDLAQVGVAADPARQVERLAGMARDAGLDGLVCSPLEVASLRELVGPAPLLVTPGIRPTGADTGDQRRVATPAAALAAGASHLVIGRPITAAPSPLDAARSLLAGLP
jgi:orotidine-5'-phosphate decarboxylase